jgi:hypothetical protein
MIFLKGDQFVMELKKVCWSIVKAFLQRIAKMLSALTKKDRFSLFSSSFTNKTQTIIQLSQMFSIE